MPGERSARSRGPSTVHEERPRTKDDPGPRRDQAPRTEGPRTGAFFAPALMRARQKDDNHRSPIMKRTERQHLKENELQRVGREAREMIERRRSETTVIVAVVAVVAVVALGYVMWRQQVQSKASGL